MTRRLTLAATATLLAACSALPRAASGPWPECAEAQARVLLAAGIPSSWPAAGALPEGEAIQRVDLGADPPEAIHDALIRTLHLAPGRNAFYVRQTGGIAGIDALYGPVSLQGRCPAPRTVVP